MDIDYIDLGLLKSNRYIKCASRPKYKVLLCFLYLFILDYFRLLWCLSNERFMFLSCICNRNCTESVCVCACVRVCVCVCVFYILETKRV